MDFNPGLPATNSPIVSAELRNQFNALNDQHVTLMVRVGEMDVRLIDATDIANSSAWSPGGVAPLGMTVSNPPTQAQVQAIANKLDELVAALKR